MAMRGIELCWPGKGERLLPADGPTMADLDLVERIGEGDGWCNLLVHGDNLVAAQALLERFAGAVELVYIDPPYATGLSYVSHAPASGQRAIERSAYRDRHQGGVAGYLEAMRLRLALIHRLLSPSGKLFVHCDWRVNALLRLLLDELFGADCFRNEIVWRRAPNLGRQAASRQLGRVIDTIYVYSKSPASPFAGDPPRRRSEAPLDRQGKPRSARWDAERQAYFTTAPRGDYTDDSIEKLRAQGRIYQSPTGTIYVKYFLARDPESGRWFRDQPVDTLWDDFEVRPLRHRPKREDMGYDTQKPEGLLARIIGWGSRPGDLVADLFVGSGTTLAVAERLGRRWIGCDLGHAAIDVTFRRLLDLRRETGGGAPFALLDTARCERRAWLAALGAGTGDRAPEVACVLGACGARPLEHRWGERGGALVYVAPSDALLDAQAVSALCRQAATRGATAVALLAWQWGSDDAAAIRERAHACHGVTLTMHTIPIELAREAAPGPGLALRERSEVVLTLGRQGDCWQVALRGVRCAPPAGARVGDDPATTPWQQLVAGWTVSFVPEGAHLARCWRSHRSRLEPLALETPAEPLAAAGDGVLVTVTTVYGDRVARFLELRR